MSPLTESWYWWSFNSWYPSFDSLLRLEWIPKRVWWPSPHALSLLPNDIFPFRSTLIWCFLVAEMNSKFSILDIVKTKNEPRNQSLTSVVLISSHPFFSSFRECLATLKVGTRTSSMLSLKFCSEVGGRLFKQQLPLEGWRQRRQRFRFGLGGSHWRGGFYWSFILMFLFCEIDSQ